MRGWPFFRYILYNFHMTTTFGNCNYSNAEIQKLFITPWTTDLITYFDTGHTITSITGLTEVWNEIPINTATATFVQVLNEPNPNGINHTETLEIFVPNSNISKWLDLVDVLTERYTIVFQDGNDQWFCFGWRFGTKLQTYSLGENQYSISFINPFSTALVNSISETYVTSNLI